VLVCFFEGEDVKYYGSRLEMINPHLKWEAINCQGKGSSLKLREIISGHELYSSAKTAFFFDADFDAKGSLPNAANVYITPCYSIENFYVTDSAAKRIFRAEFGICEIPDEEGSFGKCLGLFKSRLSDYLDAIEPANSWILFHRQREAGDQTIKPLNLASLKPNQMVCITLNSVTRTYTIFDLQAATGNTEPVTENELSELAKSFDRGDRHLIFRGKFQAFFMRVFLNLLRADAVADAPACFHSRRNVPLNVTDRNFLSDLTQYADTPDCLRRFICALN
jgi:hypothetical protein